MRYIKCIPNMLTLSRIGIAMLLDIMIIMGVESGRVWNQIVLITSLTIALYATDFIDGKLARALNCTSKFGARLDIVADFFYIISQVGILVYYGVMSKWILVMIIMEFVVFIISSMKAIKITGIQQIWFDRIGRMTAVYYYAMPLVYWMIAQLQELRIYISLALTADLLCVLLTAAAIGSRLAVVVGTVDISME